MTDALSRYRAGFEPGPGVHFNNAGIAPMCVPARAAVERTARLMTSRHAVGGADALFEAYGAAKASVAKLVGARAEDVSMTGTCAAAISQAALGFSFSTDDEIVTWDQEYPSNAYPWHAAAHRDGARVVVVPSEADLSLDTERLVDAIGPKTRAVAVSWVQFSTGAVTDLKAVSEACRRVGAWLVVDAIQGLGVIPFDMQELGVDVVCGGCLKWLCGPLGHGFLVMGEERRRALTPLLHGAMNYGTADEGTDPARTPRVDGRRFEPGEPPLLSAAGCEAAIEHALGAGVAVLQAEALRLSDRLREGLEQRGAKVLSPRAGRDRSPILTFVPEGSMTEASARLTAGGVAHALRGGGIRLAPHAHNTDDDVDAFFAALDAD